MAKSIIMGTVFGLVFGTVFSILYFGEMQLTSPMGYVHEVSGAVLGFLIGWIVGLSRRAKKK